MTRAAGTQRLVTGFVVLALVALPACLDPIVGGECKAGFSPCHGVCAPAGTCQALDASGEKNTVLDGAESEAAAILDGAGGEASAGLDAGSVDGEAVASEDAGADGEGLAAVDGGQPGLSGEDASEDAPEDASEDASEDTATDDSADGEPADGSDDLDLPLDLPSQEDLALLQDASSVSVLDADDAGVDAEADDLGCVGCLDGESEAGGALDGGGDAIAVDTGPLACSDSQIACGDQCVDPLADPQNCGSCNNPCESGGCLAGRCLTCDPGERACGQQCTNLATNPDNCGACGTSCMSGLCSNGHCEAAGTGRVVVIGHDYYKNRAAMNRILGNAVFLWPVNPVRLLTYPGYADQAAIDGANAAIAQVATATGRRADAKAATDSAEVPSDLASADVFLIYGQAGAGDATLSKLGQDWKLALSSFVLAGGTVIVLDAGYTTNSGTVQILSQAGLFDITRAGSGTGDTCGVVTGGDALAMGLPRTYLCETNSTTFSIGDTALSITTVVADASADSFAPVVVHKLF